MCKIKVSFYRTYHLTGIPNREPEERECKDIMEALLYVLPMLFSKDVCYITLTDTWEKEEKKISITKYRDGKFHIDTLSAKDLKIVEPKL